MLENAAVRSPIPVRGRLAPSPTGALHLGNARTFLLAWLSLRAQGGAVVLRVEDLDGPRLKAGAEASALDDLRWLGLDWDEGPDVGGPHAPYRQTERTSRYREALDALVARGLAYPCVCTRSEIESAASAPNAGDHETPYPGTCRGRYKSIEDAEAASGRPAALRFATAAEEVSFDDGFAGAQRWNPSLESGDFVVEKVERSGAKSGRRTAAYQLACAVDDAAMDVGEVLRGDDLLGSTARQMLLQRALGFATPRYIHTPLLVGEDGRRLAKRHGDTTLRRLRESGLAAEQLVGWLAHRSGLIATERAVRARDLVERFDVHRVPAAPCVVTAEEIARLTSGSARF